MKKMNKDFLTNVADNYEEIFIDDLYKNMIF